MAFNMEWDKTGERFYETGVDRGALYVMSSGTYQDGVAWNGLSAVTEGADGGEATSVYADNIKYLTMMSSEDKTLTIEAYTYPDEFAVCDGSVEATPGLRIGQQTRQHFGFSWRSLIGNDEDGTDHGYKIHIVYDCLASPSERAHNTVNDSPEAESMSWDVSTTPVKISTQVDGKTLKPSAGIEIDSRTCPAAKLTALEEKLYGTGETAGSLPTIDEVIALLKATA